MEQTSSSRASASLTPEKMEQLAELVTLNLMKAQARFNGSQAETRGFGSPLPLHSLQIPH